MPPGSARIAPNAGPPRIGSGLSKSVTMIRPGGGPGGAAAAIIRLRLSESLARCTGKSQAPTVTVSRDLVCQRLQ